MNDPKRVLVTGAAGFIGSHTVLALLRRGDTVVGLDNFDDYYAPDRKRRQLDEIRAEASPDAEARFTFVEADIRDRQRIDTLFAAHRFDAIVHLAAMAGVRASVDRPAYYYDVNLLGTLSLLDATAAHGRPNFVLASTSSAYGRTEQIPFVETDCADRPLAPYPASKRAAELLAHSYHHLHGLDVTALRFFTVYGPRNRPDMMAHKLLDNLYVGRTVPLYEGGQMYRDWTYVDDIVDGVVRAADRRLGYEIINLGRGEPVLLADFVRHAEELTGKTARLDDAPMDPADVHYTYADITKARELLGYDPQTSVRDGVARFLEWYQRQGHDEPEA